MLDFKCPVCGGEVRAEMSSVADFVTIDFTCRQCGRFASADITPEAIEAMEDAMDYFSELVERIEGNDGD